MLKNKENLTKLDGIGLVSVCSWCKKVRDPYGNWLDPGVFFFNYYGGKLTHTICEQCCDLYFPDFSRESFESHQKIIKSHQQVDT